MDKREKLGSFWVDTATILLADPCQVIADKGESPRWDYEGFIELFDAQGIPRIEPAVTIGGREIIPAFERVIPATHVKLKNRYGHAGGIAVMVGCDGWYPVYLERDEDGNPSRLIIELGGHVEP